MAKGDKPKQPPPPQPTMHARLSAIIAEVTQYAERAKLNGEDGALVVSKIIDARDSLGQALAGLKLEPR